MKLFFLKDDSLYKIFKTLEKIQTWKKVELYIESDNSFFDNEWRCVQIKDIIEKKKLEVTFVVEGEKQKNVLERAGLKIHYKHTNTLAKILHTLYLFFFNIKKFHFYVYNKKNYVFYLIFMFELGLVLVVMYVLYSLILPSTKITIYPAYTLEDVIYNFRYYPASDLWYPNRVPYLTIPYHKTQLDYTHHIAVSIKDLQYFQNPSYGTVRFINKDKEPLSLIKETQLVTDEWLQYRIIKRVEIPWMKSEFPWVAYVDVIAQDSDTHFQIMGDRWNIKQGTKMYVKKLKNSLYRKQLYAEALYDFAWGETIIKSTIDQEDFASLSWKLLQFMHNNKQSIVKEKISDPDTLLLSFPALIDLDDYQVNFHVPQWKQWSGTMITGSISTTIWYKFVYRDDVLDAVNIYLHERKSDSVEFISIDRSSFALFDMINNASGVITIPTKVWSVQWYDFAIDSNRIQSEIKATIPWLSKEEAEDYIISYPEIGTVSLTINPPRYSDVSQVKSRIFIEVNEKK